MTETDLQLWRTKLAAWLHDPAEKALILYRTLGGHEAGTVAKLMQLCFGADAIPKELADVVRRADHWASAADRPQLPRPKGAPGRDGKVLFWGREGAELVHPLGGDRYHLPDLYVAPARIVEAATFLGLEPLLGSRATGTLDTAEGLKRAVLGLWRLGPEGPPEDLAGLGHLWRLLPADTRVPDHSIWDHLALTSAFAGAMAADDHGSPALLLVSLGPVQGFIEQARTVSDLWAGSHLLSTMAWQALKVVCERLGPDAVVFPRLWGVPVVDRWLEEEQGVALPGDLDWKRLRSDANPLFAAALPNKLVAVVPASEAEAVAAAITAAVRGWALGKAREAALRLLEDARAGSSALPEPMARQVELQLDEFPEVHWAAVPWGQLVEWSARGTVETCEKLERVLNALHPADASAPGFLGTDQWKLLREAIEEGVGAGSEAAFSYRPNPGVLYPALHDLAERLHGAAKTTRRFVQLPQQGYRCSLCGEREWLTAEPAQLQAPPGRRRETVWQSLGDGAVARKGEHLCARCTLKRYWPRMFTEEVSHIIGGQKLSRYVVSTHTMALAGSFAQWLQDDGKPKDLVASAELRAVNRFLGEGHQTAALPRGLLVMAQRFGGAGNPELERVLRRVPVRLDELRDEADDQGRAELESALKDLLGHRPEAYYGLIQMDGDRMGAWVAGSDDALALRYRDTWHPALLGDEDLRRLEQRNQRVARYLNSPRPSSPARHAAISGALNDFSTRVARWVVEDLSLGKLVYSGGDDVLAMVPVGRLLSCLLLLRCAYSGTVPDGMRKEVEGWLGAAGVEADIGGGHVKVGGRLLRMMGTLATASAGAVVAHHATPLQAALREVREAEQRAKRHDRNAFSVTLMKRSGGVTQLTAGWGFGGQSQVRRDDSPTAAAGLMRLKGALAAEGVSRRAAYHILEWLPGIPPWPGPDLDEAAYRALLERTLAYQLGRQGVDRALGAGVSQEVAAGMAAAALSQSRPEGRRATWSSVTACLGGMVSLAEFLAREGRGGAR